MIPGPNSFQIWRNTLPTPMLRHRALFHISGKEVQHRSHSKFFICSPDRVIRFLNPLQGFDQLLGIGPVEGHVGNSN